MAEYSFCQLSCHLLLKNVKFSSEKKTSKTIKRIDTPPKFNGWNLKVMVFQVRNLLFFFEVPFSGAPNQILGEYPSELTYLLHNVGN